MPKNKITSFKPSEIVSLLYTALRDDKVSFLELSEGYIKPYLEAFATGDLEQITALVQASERIQAGEDEMSLNDALAERHIIERGTFDTKTEVKKNLFKAVFALSRLTAKELNLSDTTNDERSHKLANPLVEIGILNLTDNRGANFDFKTQIARGSDTTSDQNQIVEFVKKRAARVIEAHLPTSESSLLKPEKLVNMKLRAINFLNKINKQNSLLNMFGLKQENIKPEDQEAIKILLTPVRKK